MPAGLMFAVVAAGMILGVVVDVFVGVAAKDVLVNKSVLIRRILFMRSPP